MEITFQYLLKDNLYSLEFFHKFVQISFIYLIAVANFFRIFKSNFKNLPLNFNPLILNIIGILNKFLKYLPLAIFKIITSKFKLFKQSSSGFKSIFFRIFLLRYISFIAKILNISPLLYFYVCFLVCTETLGFTALLWCNFFSNKELKLKSEVIFQITENKKNFGQILFLVIILFCYLITIFHSYFLLLLGKLPNTFILGYSAKVLTSKYIRYKLKRRKFKFRIL